MKLNKYKIPSLKELKTYNIKELINVSNQIRELLIELSKEKQIHFSSNLGIVELSIALLYCFDSPDDKIIYDTGHQSYVHKILTNRFDKIDTIRDYGGLSGFQEPNESEHDFISNGHSGTALSIAQGLNEHKNDKNFYVPIVGDAAISNGLSFEALNSIAFNNTKMIIVVNDNDMSISKNVGMLSKKMSKLRTSKINFIGGNFVREIFGKRKWTKNIYLFFSKISYFFENFIYSNNFFQSMGYKYIGPVDGHDIYKLIYAIKKAKWYANVKPVVLHIKTIKGYGHNQATLDTCGNYHSSSLSNNQSITFGDVAAKYIEMLINKQQYKIVVLNPAMTLSTGFLDISNKYKKNYEDIGIAEEHCITKAVGITKADKKVFVVIYSTFLQRAYDQIAHDVARNKIPITFLIDRADIAYSDGDTHHGIYDVAFLKTIPNTIISAPSNRYELENLIEMSMSVKDAPFFIRYPKTECIDYKYNQPFVMGDWVFKQKYKNCNKLIISYGPIINDLLKHFSDKKIDIVNAIFLTQYNKNKVINLLKSYKQIFVIEKVYHQNNLYNDLLKISYENGVFTNIKSICIQTSDIGFGEKQIIDKELKIDMDSILQEIIG